MITRVLSTRLGALMVAGILALAAVAVVLVYASNYQDSVSERHGDVTVLVATQQITQFTPGNQVVDGQMFRESKVPTDALVDGAVSDPDALKGLVARGDIYPGEQLSTNQFTKSDTASVAVKLDPDQRSISFPVDPASGLVGQVQTGDRVDVVATFDVLPLGPNGLPLTGAQAIPVTKTIVSNALVLAAPDAPGSTEGRRTNPVLNLAVDVEDVQHAIFAQQKGSIWFVLRPPGEAADVKPTIVDVDAVLRGVPSARDNVLRITGGR